ncbi:MAG: hypothetical protein ACRENF_02650 [Thermodesulfobacteriota bacterium]
MEREQQDKRIEEFKERKGITDKPKKRFMFGEKIRELKERRAVAKERKLVKKIEKRKEKKEDDAERMVERERKVHGRVLEPKERLELAEAKRDLQKEKLAKQEKHRQQFHQFRRNVQVVRKKAQGFNVLGNDIFNVNAEVRKPGGLDELGMGRSVLDARGDLGGSSVIDRKGSIGPVRPTKSILDISSDLTPQKREFEDNFTRMLVGQKSKRAKRSKHPLSI